MKVTTWTKVATLTGKLTMTLPGAALRRAANAVYGVAFRQMRRPHFDGERWLEQAA